MLSLFIISACNPVKDKKVDQTTIGFKTDESSKLFFKNVRRSYYDVEVMEEAKLEIYRLKKRVKESDEPILNINIGHKSNIIANNNIFWIPIHP